MSEEKKEKRCSGCKTPKTIDNFYKNKLVLDGHSNYCIDCTRENSKRYFQKGITIWIDHQRILHIEC